MKRFTIVILTLFFFITNTLCSYSASYTKKNLSVSAKDGFSLKAVLTYPKEKGRKIYKTVVLLHSHGTNSLWWGDLPDNLLGNGYAVLTIDLRGHGQSVYNSALKKVSWKSLKNSAYQKYPDDIIQVIKYINDEFPKMKFFNEWAIVGSDIGASAGIIAADRLDFKPKTIVLLSPVVQTRGLYIPVSIAQLSNVDFLSIASVDDPAATEAQNYLKKFAQNEFSIYTSSSKSSGMVLLKNDPEIVPIITEWINQYLKN